MRLLRRRKGFEKFRFWGARPVDASLLSVPIERADGSTVTDLRGRRKWSPLADGARDADGDEAITVRHLLKEKHRRAYGSPWAAGAVRVRFLIDRGLPPDARLLDIGCGGGRLGVDLIRHLRPGRYFGIDAHLRSLVAFSAYELRLAGLAHKRPRLLHDEDFRFDAFGERFDAALDTGVSAHFDDDRTRAVYQRLRPLLTPDARVFVQRLKDRRLPELIGPLGYRLEAEVPIEWPDWLDRDPGRFTEIWSEFRPD